jgi:hypothetical protein
MFLRRVLERSGGVEVLLRMSVSFRTPAWMRSSSIFLINAISAWSAAWPASAIDTKQIAPVGLVMSSCGRFGPRRREMEAIYRFNRQPSSGLVERGRRYVW